MIHLSTLWYRRQMVFVAHSIASWVGSSRSTNGLTNNRNNEHGRKHKETRTGVHPKWYRDDIAPHPGDEAHDDERDDDHVIAQPMNILIGTDYWDQWIVGMQGKNLDQLD